MTRQSTSLGMNFQDAVKHTRNSPQRIKTFKQATKDVAVETQRFLCAETPTRRNSTFEFLRSAYDVIDAFLEYSYQDPQWKSKFMKIVFTQILKAKNKDNKMFVDEIESKPHANVIDIECKLDKFIKTYMERPNMTSSSQQETPKEVNFEDENKLFGSYMTSGSVPSTSLKSQLQRYLKKDPIRFDKGYDILTWWKNNAMRYPIIARMARDILGMKISTVASESTLVMVVE
ncbi:unnamed protein product [Lactuca saligna]|uniref:HAT C-terminal dimerisation domain-containing protein n=1 Tax=Lactuca saligna TaxID=75948 RepID=A0AA36E9C6_LACSI|nr:unnamed protein product [Lactuca saligna]